MSNNRATFVVEGDKQVRDAIAAIKGNVNKVVLPAVEQGAQVVLDEAVDRVPVDEGLLRDNLELKEIHNDMLGVWFVVGADYKKAPHLHLVEFGTVHSKANPFMRSAVDSRGAEATQQIIDEILKGLGF